MPSTSLILFDDDIARSWEPFALTRPAGEMLFGAFTFRERAGRVLGAECRMHVAASHLRGFDEPGAPPVGTLADVAVDEERVFLLSRAVPGWDAADRWASERRPGPISIGGQVAGWLCAPGEPSPGEDFLRRLVVPENAPEPLDLPGRIVEHVWDLVGENADQIATDAGAAGPDGRFDDPPAGVLAWGEHPILVEGDVTLEPGCAIDTSAGPVWLSRGVTVRAFTRLAGPAYVGPESQLLGGSISSVSLGPVCRVRGEMSDTVCLGYTNKQHDGHIGHAYLGRWVNIGAGTNNSDLKNNYSTIRLWTPDGDRDTGTIKMGCLLGDHVKTGIAVVLNTGTVVGAGSNLYGTAMPPKFVPPFSWGSGEELVEFRLDKFLEVAERAMLRRDVHLSDSGRHQLRSAWERGRSKWGTGSSGSG